MKTTTRILIYLAIIAIVGGLFALGAPEVGDYGSVEGWSVYVLCAIAACVGLIVGFEVLHRMWRR
jgi:hypothetical protein